MKPKSLGKKHRNELSYILARLRILKYNIKDTTQKWKKNYRSGFSTIKKSGGKVTKDAFDK